MALLLKLLAVGLSLWAIRYYWRTQPPLDRLAGRVRWLGLAACVALWLVEYALLRMLPQPKAWIDGHLVTFVLMAAPPSFGFALFLFLPDFSRAIAAYLRGRGGI
jgi:hypothetical protein